MVYNELLCVCYCIIQVTVLIIGDQLLPHVVKYSKLSTCWSLWQSISIFDKAELFQTPGPGAYSPERAPPLNLHSRPPSYSIGSRTRYRATDTVPAPNSYTLPSLMGARSLNKPCSPCYSMSGRRKTGSPSEDLAMTPGPGKYNSTDPSIYLNRQPSFSMQSRTSIPSDATRKPGPGTHSSEKVVAHLPRPPSYSLGIRHSEFVTPLVVDVLDWDWYEYEGVVLLVSSMLSKLPFVHIVIVSVCLQCVLQKYYLANSACLSQTQSFWISSKWKWAAIKCRLAQLCLSVQWSHKLEEIPLNRKTFFFFTFSAHGLSLSPSYLSNVMCIDAVFGTALLVSNLIWSDKKKNHVLYHCTSLDRPFKILTKYWIYL